MKRFAAMLPIAVVLGADPSCGVNRNRLSYAPSPVESMALGMVYAKGVWCTGGDVGGYTNVVARKNLSTKGGGILIEQTGWYMLTHGWKITPDSDGIVVSYIYASEMPTPVRLVQEVRAGAMDAGSASALYLAQAGERLHIVVRGSASFTIQEGVLTAVQQID